ncbi:MAG: class I SAM-dependent methyltransferase [Actinomycetota bacterium]
MSDQDVLANDRRQTRPDPAELRQRLHGMWESVAPAWGRNAEKLEDRLGRVGNKMLELMKLQPGERVLDLASGPGGAGLAAARLVGPGGHVVLSDVSPTMVAIAADRARAKALDNVSALVLDLEDIDQPDGLYDAVICREGLMLVPDPEKAAGEIRRVLRPGGRAAVSVLSAREQNPWLGILMDALSLQIGSPVPPPGVPGPFSIPNPAALAGLLSDAGLVDVNVIELPLPLQVGTFEDWWALTTALAGPITRVLASMPEPALMRAQEEARKAAAPFQTPDGLEFPGPTQVAFARRADSSY